MKISYALRKDLDSLCEIEIVAHMIHEPDFDVESVDEYVWQEKDFFEFSNSENGHRQLFALFDDSPLPTGFIAYIIHQQTRTFVIEKLESLRDEQEERRLEFMLRWLILKAREANIVFLLEETASLKIQLFKGLGFKGLLRKNAFGKNNNDGIFFSRFEGRENASNT